MVEVNVIFIMQE